jgi:hypothetical protein
MYSSSPSFASRDGLLPEPDANNNTQQKQAQQTLTEVSSSLSPRFHSPIDDDDDDATDRSWIAGSQICFLSVQAKPRCLGHRRQHSPGGYIPPDQMWVDIRYPIILRRPYRREKFLMDMLTKILDIALQVLDDVIMTRWKVLPRDQCQGNDGLL